MAKYKGGFRIRYPLKDFDGGLNNKYDPRQIKDNESTDAKNVIFDEYGSIETRRGSEPVNLTTPVGSYSCDGLFTTYFDDGSTSMVAFFGSDMQVLNATTFVTVPSSTSFRTAGVKVDYTLYQNYMFIGWGQTPYKYNGTELTRHEIGSGSIGSATTNSDGTLTGTYYYKVTNVNSALVESRVSSHSTALTLSAGEVLLEGIETFPASYGVDARKIYRTEAITSTTTPNSATFYLVTTLEDNTATTFVDNVSDSELGAEPPVDNDPPPNWKLVKAFQERLWCVSLDEPTTLYYSDLGEPFTFNASNFIRVGFGDGQEITGLGVHANSIIIYKEASVYLLYLEDTTPANWVLVKTNAKYGGAGHRSIVDYGDMQMYVGTNYKNISGFLALKGTSIDPSVTELKTTAIYGETKSEVIEPEVFNFNEAYLDDIAGIIYKNKIWMSVAKGTSVYNNYIYQYDFLRSGETPYQTGSWVPFTGMNINCFTIYNDTLYGGTALENGIVYELDVEDYYADKVDSATENAIDSYFWSKEFEGDKGEEDFQKDFRYINLIIENSGDWNMNLNWKLDSDAGDGSSEQINLNPGGSLWDDAVLGVDDWGGGNVRKNVRVSFGKSSGKALQIGFDNQNTVNQKFKVIRGNFYYNRKGLR